MLIGGFVGKPSAGESGFYNDAIDYSVSLDVTSTSEMNRTESGSPTDLTKQTISFWVKRTVLTSAYKAMFSGDVNGTNDSIVCRFKVTTDKLILHYEVGGSESSFISDASFRDCSTWYHIVVVWDSTSGTAADRIPQVYVNNQSIADDLGGWSTETNNISQNDPTYFQNGTATNTNTIGAQSAGASLNFDGLMADFICVDGQALTPSSFGESNNGVWIPKSYAGTYGNLGLHLDFADNTDFGNDVSGNGNDFTDQNLGTDHQLTDTPEDNACTFDYNASRVGVGLLSIDEGGLKLSYNSSPGVIGTGTFPMKSGKWYWEYNVGTDTSYSGTGVIHSNKALSEKMASSVSLLTADDVWLFYCDGAGGDYEIYNNDGGTADTNLDAPAESDIVMVAFDADANKIWFGVNGTWGNFGGGVGDPANGNNPAYTNMDAQDNMVMPFGMVESNSTGAVWNFGQASFTYTAPTGFNALKASNIPDPVAGTAVVSDKSFGATYYTGDGAASQGITGLGFQPDLVWIKNRDVTDIWNIYDVDRGATKYLNSDDAAAGEVTDADNGLASFDADGFTVGYNDTDLSNVNTENYAGICLKENTAAGFEIINYTGNGNSGRTISHNLEQIPQMIIVRRYDDASSWYVYHFGLNNGTNPEQYYLVLETTTAETDSTSPWNDTAPTDSVFTVNYPGSGTWTNASGADYVAYLFADVEGSVKCFNQIGNSQNGQLSQIIHLGFKPAWIMYKATTNAIRQWVSIDIGRQSHNNSTGIPYLFTSLNNAESSGNPIDIYANGIKTRTSNSNVNTITRMLGVAVSEESFKYANAR